MNLRLAFVTLSLVVLAPLGVVVASPPRVGAPVLVIVPPWLDAGGLISIAGGQVIGPTTAPLAVLAFSDDPDFSKTLLRFGALGVRDGSLVAKLCGAKV